MSQAKLPHPGPDRLRAFRTGQLPPEQAAEVERHLAACESCRATAPFDGANSRPTGPESDGDILRHHTTSRPASPADGPGQASGELPERFGRYRIRKCLGRGGMGSVYLAEDTQLGRRVALKVPHFGPGDGPRVLERFCREARAAATFVHPNLCPVYDVGEIDGTHYLTMAFIEGRPLADLIRPDRPLPQRQVALLVRKLALALQVAHDKEVIHRDLKPANIMINTAKEPVVMDFGIARTPQQQNQDARLTRVGAVIGTPGYMAPEQVEGKVDAMGPGCDIYSLGVILYELLTGRLPFEGPPLVVLGQVLTVEPPPPTTLRPDVDAKLEAICLRALSKRVEDRFASMTDMAGALGEYLRTTSTPAAAPGKAPATSAADVGTLEPTGLVRPPQQTPVHPRTLREARPGGSPTVAGPRRRPHWRWLAAGGLAIGMFACVLVFLLTQRRDGPHQPGRAPDAVQRSAPGTQGRPAVAESRGAEGSALPAAPAVPAAPARSGDGWTALFNGKDLSGWDVIQDLKPPQKPLAQPKGWEVRDGTLVCTTGEFVWLRTRLQYQDFVLRLEFRSPRNKANSGIYVRNPGDKTGWDGLMVQIFGDDDKVKPERRTGGITDVIAPAELAKRPAGEWNELEVECRGPAVRVVLNGKVTVQAAVTEYRALADRPRTGYIGLANFQGEAEGMAFRNIQIKDLSGVAPAPPPAVQPPPDARAALQGEWVVVAEEWKGKPSAAADIQQQAKTLVFDGDRLTFTRQGKDRAFTSVGTVRVAGGAIDFTGTDYFGQPREFRGIFEQTGDTLRLAYPNTNEGLVRPTAFASSADSSTLVVVARRYVREQPERRRLDELMTNPQGWITWVSADGLTIYWQVGGTHPTASIWTASRKGPASPFEQSRRLLAGRHATLSPDGLEMILLVARTATAPFRESLHVARRPSLDQPFGTPQPIPELAAENSGAPCLSADGLTLTFVRSATEGNEFWFSTRSSLGASWASPQRLRMALDQVADRGILWPFVTADGRALFCTHEGPVGRSRFMKWTRSPSGAFEQFTYLQVPSVPDFSGRLFRYVEATQELFYTAGRPGSAGVWDMWVLRNYRP